MVFKYRGKGGTGIPGFPDAPAGRSHIEDAVVGRVEFQVVDTPAHQGRANVPGPQVAEQVVGTEGIALLACRRQTYGDGKQQEQLG